MLTAPQIIDSAEEMFVERLHAWYDSQNGRLPSKIIYYRDGVGNTQYDDVLTGEVDKIELAFATVKAAKATEMKAKGHIVVDKPSITVVVVTKRHHTRFYPDTQDKKRNCEPGTVVESGVTHPCYFDFYLQSHTPVQGTAKPTYYVVIRNDMAFNAAQMQDLTNALCYIYARCCLPVGYCPAAYYADRLCEQARLYVKRTNAATFGYGTEPVRPDTVTGETPLQRAAKIRIWKGRVTQWKNDITDEWKRRHVGPAHGGVKSNGPWHAKLNDTMFWM